MLDNTNIWNIYSIKNLIWDSMKFIKKDGQKEILSSKCLERQDTDTYTKIIRKKDNVKYICLHPLKAVGTNKFKYGQDRTQLDYK